MTKKDAILCLKGMKNYARDTFTEQTDWQESLDMAIEALEEDTVSRQAVLDMIDNSLKIIDEYKAESEEQDYQWIPVNERLPEEESDVLVCNVNGDIEIARGSYSTEFKNEFIWYTSGWKFGKVTAWMPLPYKESEE